MVAVKEMVQLVYWFEIFDVIAGLKIFEGHFRSLVLSKTSTCPEIITPESPVDSGLCNMWMQRMLLMLNIEWMVKFSKVVS